MCARNSYRRCQHSPLLSAGLLLWWAVTPVHALENGVRAQEARVSIEEIVVVGTRLPESPSQGAGFELDSDELGRQAPISVQQALQTSPGLYISQPGGRGGVASLSIRGGESNFAVVLVDGVAVNDPTNTRGGSFDFATIDIADVERVELLRGPGSAVYGSDALAGVVSIHTSAFAQPHDRFSLTLGEDSLRQLSASLARGALDSGAYSLSASLTDDSNPEAGADFSSQGLRLGFQQQRQRHRFRALVSYADVDQRAYPEDSGGRLFSVFDGRDDRQSDSLSAALMHQFELAEAWTVQTDLTLFRRGEVFESPGVAGGPRNPFGVPENESDSDFQKLQVSTFARYRAQRMSIVAGTQWIEEDGEAEGSVEFLGPTFFELERHTLGLFLELQVQLSEQLGIAASGRVDKPDGESQEPTFGVSAEYEWTPRVVGFVSAGSGFKLPSFFALGNPLVGNPNLSPERVDSWEAGLRVGAERGLDAELTYFHSRYEDLIDFDSDLFTNVNRSDSTMAGWDLSIRLAAPSERMTLRAFASYVDIDLEPEGRLRQRPQWRVGATLALEFSGRATVHVSWQHNDHRFDSSIPRGDVVLDSYQRLDVAGHWQITQSLRLTAAVDNALDEAYSDADGSPANGRRARLRLSWER